jgi:hypothetical protein
MADLQDLIDAIGEAIQVVAGVANLAEELTLEGFKEENWDPQTGHGTCDWAAVETRAEEGFDDLVNALESVQSVVNAQSAPGPFFQGARISDEIEEMLEWDEVNWKPYNRILILQGVELGPAIGGWPPYSWSSLAVPAIEEFADQNHDIIGEINLYLMDLIDYVVCCNDCNANITDINESGGYITVDYEMTIVPSEGSVEVWARNDGCNLHGEIPVESGIESVEFQLVASQSAAGEDTVTWQQDTECPEYFSYPPYNFNFEYRWIEAYLVVKDGDGQTVWQSGAFGKFLNAQ